MKYPDFKHKIKTLCEKNGEKRPKIVDIMYIFNKYKNIFVLIENTLDARNMIRFSKLDQKDRLLYRMKLAEEGIELTPYQIDLYINAMTIAAEEYLDTH